MEAREVEISGLPDRILNFSLNNLCITSQLAKFAGIIWACKCHMLVIDIIKQWNGGPPGMGSRNLLWTFYGYF